MKKSKTFEDVRHRAELDTCKNWREYCMESKSQCQKIAFDAINNFVEIEKKVMQDNIANAHIAMNNISTKPKDLITRKI